MYGSIGIQTGLISLEEQAARLSENTFWNTPASLRIPELLIQSVHSENPKSQQLW